MNILHVSHYFIPFLLLVFATMSPAMADSHHKTRVLTAKVTKVDYFEVEMEIELYVAMKLSSGFMRVTVDGISEIEDEIPITTGTNKRTVHIPRQGYRNESVTTPYVVITVGDGNRKLYEQRRPFQITWPGPETVELAAQQIQTASVHMNRIAEVHVNRKMATADLIVRALIASGYPVTRIHAYHMPGRGQDTVFLSTELGLETMRDVLYVITNGMTNPPYVFFRPLDRRDVDKVLVGKRIPKLESGKVRKPITTDQFARLRRSGLGDREFFAMFNPSSEMRGGPFDPEATRVLGVRLLKVDYFEAAIEIEFHLAGKKKASLDAHIESISQHLGRARISQGLNTKTVYIPRQWHRDRGVQTTNMRIMLYDGYGPPFFEQNVELEIPWPGPQWIRQLVPRVPPANKDLQPIAEIIVERALHDSDNIIRGLVENGYPLSRIRTLRWDGARQNTIVMSPHMDTTAMRTLMRIVANSMTSRPLIEFKTVDKNIHDDAFVGIRVSKPKSERITEEQFTRLKSPDLGNDELLAMFKLTRLKHGDRAKLLYDQAYTLIDEGGDSNLRRAKGLLDQLISFNPDYPRAYLEIARYHMKSNYPDNWEQGLRKAERSILLAKEIDPELADTLVLLGYVYTNQGRYEEAEAEYQLAERLGTDNLWLYANWGLNYEMQDQAKQAIEKYLKVVNAPKTSRDDRNYRPRKWTFGSTELFAMLIEEKQYELADKLYEKSASEYYYHRCDLQKQAAVRVQYLEDDDGAIDSYLRSTQKGCKREGHGLSVAYFMKWRKLKDSNANAAEVASAYRQAESSAPEDDVLFYGLAKSDRTARVIGDVIAGGHDIDYVSNRGKSALLRSIQDKDLKATERLIVHGAEINIQTLDYFRIPIVHAIFLGETAIVKLLLHHKADIGFKLNNVMSLADYAKMLGHDRIARLLSDRIES